MGVVNVTPDSFSDGGRWFTPGAAVAHGLELLAQGADLLDVGGESTRPGARRVPVDDELARVLPVIEALVARGAASASTPPARSSRGRPSSAAPSLVNDVSGGLADDDDVRGGRRRRARSTWRCTGAGTRTSWTTSTTTTTW